MSRLTVGFNLVGYGCTTCRQSPHQANSFGAAAASQALARWAGRSLRGPGQGSLGTDPDAIPSEQTGNPGDHLQSVKKEMFESEYGNVSRETAWRRITVREG